MCHLCDYFSFSVLFCLYRLAMHTFDKAGNKNENCNLIRTWQTAKALHVLFMFFCCLAINLNEDQYILKKHHTMQQMQ